MFTLSSLAQSIAWDLAAARRAMPSGLSSREQREKFSRSMRQRVHVMARVSSARFADEVKKAVDELLAGKTSRPVLIARLQALLAKLGYTPETGFPGDARLGIPPAKPGSLRDLSSWKRLELILNTEAELAHGRVQHLQGMTAVSLLMSPAYELVRTGKAVHPRDWNARWKAAGGPPLVNGRFVAPKLHQVWRNLGDHSLFDDALGVDHSPFWFNSHGTQRRVSRSECISLGIMNAQGEWNADYAPPMTLKDWQAVAEKVNAKEAALPTAPVNDKGLSPVVAEALQESLKPVNGGGADDDKKAKLRAIRERSLARQRAEGRAAA